MGTFGGTAWGGSGTTSGGSAGVSLSTLIMPAYRIAGITQRAMIGPSVDMYAEAIPEINRLLGSWNCDGHRIYTSAISEPFALTSGQKIYTIGPGADIDMDRPIFIKAANVLFPTDPIVRRPIFILDDIAWSRIAVQDIPGAPPYQLYYDGGLNDDGQGSIYLRFQPPAGYSLELYTWQALKTSFEDSADVAVFPPGYEHAIVYNLAKSLAALNPGMQNMQPASYRIADQALAALISLNSSSPTIDTEPGLTHDIGPGYGWLDGGIR